MPLAHRFRDPALFELAMTHASVGSGDNNERLEFLGDAILDLVVAQELFGEEPPLSEGDMTELKAQLVSRATLAGAARKMALEQQGIFGPGMRSRPLPRSVLANLYEAYLGALYLDAGLEAARRFVLRTLAEALAGVRESAETANPKQELQRRTQILTGDPPDYHLLRERGHAHAKAFLVAAESAGRRFPAAWGRTRKEAERWAAYEALLVLDAEGVEARDGA